METFAVTANKNTSNQLFFFFTFAGNNSRVVDTETLRLVSDTKTQRYRGGA